VDVLLLAVPDDAVFGTARELATSGLIGSRQAVLHLSGVLDRSALRALDQSGAALGSFHPLQTLTDPETAPTRLQGAVVTVEGDDRAVQAGENLGRALGLRPIRIASESKIRYHAGAVFASNYIVAVAEVARQILVDAGLPPESAWQGLQGLIRGTCESLAAGAPVTALTGPISRGDVATLRKHLAVLQGEQAILYRALGRVALDLTALDSERSSAMEEVLKGP
jgi:predicted short-subunit dehydrogenase-like oxidoreductase (DUF2520 family)